MPPTDVAVPGGTRRGPTCPQVLRDPGLDAQLREVGYVVVPFLDAYEVAQLRAQHDRWAAEGDEGLVIGFLRHDRTEMRELAEALAPLWARHLPEVFVDRRVVVATFVTKHPGEGSAMAPHDEPSFTDERRARSHVVWVPLVDVGPELGNGHLALLPGSAAIERGLSGYNTPVHHRPYARDLVARMVPITARAGDAVIYDARTLHASAANETGAPRPALSAAVAPASEPLVHVVATGRRHRRIHQVPDDFYLAQNPMELDVTRLDAPVVDELDEPQTLDADHLARLLGLGAAADLLPPAPLVPPDLVELVGEAAALPTGRSDAPLPDRDLVVDPARLAPADAAACAVLGDGVDAGVVVPDEVPEELRALDGDQAPCFHLVLLAGGRQVLATPEGTPPHELRILEAPMLGAGVAGTGRAHQLEPGDVVTVTADAELVLWNEGPGQLVAAVVPAGG